MIILDGVTEKLQAVLSGAVTTDQPEFQATYGILDNGVLDAYSSNDGELNSTTDVDLVAGVTNKQLGINSVSIYNKDTVSVVITIKKDISATDRFIYRVTLAPGESVHYDNNRGWYSMGAGGGQRVAQSDTHTGQVTGADELSLAVEAIINQTALTTGLTGTDELLVSDGGVLKRMDISVLTDYADTLYEGIDATILKDADIGVTVQAYDATYVVDADIGVTVQAYDATIMVDADIGVTVMGYDATMLVDADIGVNVQAYDATILVDADIGVNVQAFDATILVDADIGVNVQAYDADLTTWAGITPSANAQSLVGAATYAAMRTLLDLEVGVDFYSIAAADAAFEGADGTILKDADIGVTVQAYDATIVVDADIGVTVMGYDATMLVDADIGVNVQAYDADLTTWAGITPSANAQSLVGAATYAAMRTLLDLEAGTDFYSKTAADSTFEPIDGTILKDADIGVTVQAFDATYVVDADIGVTVMGYDATMLVDADIGVTVQAAGAYLTEVVAADINSGAATNNQVLAADGAGNAAWEDQVGGGGGGGIIWEVKTASYTLAEGEAVDANVTSAAAVFTIAATIAANHVFVIHNAVSSTKLVTVEPNTGHTIVGALGSIVGGTDTIVLKPGETIHLVALSASILEIV